MNIQVKNLSVSSKEVNIIINSNAVINSGKLVVLLGPNGCGKTTFMKTIMGVRDITNGDILLNGNSIKKMNRKELSKKVAYIPSNYFSVFSYSVTDFLMTGYAAQKDLFYVPTQKEKNIAIETLKDFGIGYLADKQYGMLSNGEQQLCLIIRGLLQNTEVIILDEPTSNLDFRHQHKVMKFIKTIVSPENIVMMSLHDPNLALQYADEIIIMGDKTISCHLNRNSSNFIKEFESELKMIYDESIKVISYKKDVYVKFDN